MSDKKYLVSEIFNSIQGEGEFTGVPTSWVRFFGCNLDCRGFGQKDPTDVETYILPYQEFDEKSVNRLEDLPVWKYGCDSSYSWAKKFKHLQRELTPVDIVEDLRKTMSNQFNPSGYFEHPYSKTHSHLCFTGGEPLLKKNQEAIVDIMNVLLEEGDMPSVVTIETNGTRFILDELDAKIKESYSYFNGEYRNDWFFSVSPKLFTVSGEKNERAIKPDVVARYNDLVENGQLKFVVGGDERQWDELDRVVKEFRDAGVYYPVWVMPVGATEEGQHGKYGSHADAGKVADMAIQRGYNVSARVHVYLWGNIIGV